jgi:hypothetical protein
VDHGAFDLDTQVRLAAFAFLEQQMQLHGEVLPYAALAAGFTFHGTRVPLLGPQGIFKPAFAPDLPLSITTAPSRPYAYEIGEVQRAVKVPERLGHEPSRFLGPRIGSAGYLGP